MFGRKFGRSDMNTSMGIVRNVCRRAEIRVGKQSGPLGVVMI